jgi:hypothetical protein
MQHQTIRRQLGSWDGIILPHAGEIKNEIAGAKKAFRLAWPHRHHSARARIVIASNLRFLRAAKVETERKEL